MATETLTKAELLKLLASFSAADVRAALKEAEAAKPTLLSLTMDAIVAAAMAGKVITDAVTKVVTETGRAAGVLKADENATSASVATLIRYAKAYDEALTRAGLETVKKAEPEEPAAEQPTSETPPVAPPAGEPGKDNAKETPPEPGNANRRRAA